MTLSPHIQPPEIETIIFDYLADVLFYISVEPGQKFRFVSVNQSFLSVTGLEKSQVVGRYIEEVIPPPSISLVIENCHRAIKEKRSTHWHEVTVYPKGTKYGDVTVVPVFDGQGNCISLIGTVHDVTPLKEADQLATSQLHNMMERISDGLVAFDRDFNYSWVNKRGAELLGKKAEDLIGKNYWVEFPEAKGTSFANAYVKAMNSQKPMEIIAEYPAWNRWFENRIYPSEDGITIFFSDITERMKKEHELLTAKKIAEAATIAKTNFLEIAAHELRNPVTGIYLMIQAILKKMGKNQVIDPSLITKLLSPAERLNRMVSDLLDLSRLEKNKVDLNLISSNMIQLIKDWIEEFQLKDPDRQITFVQPQKPAVINFDPVRIYQVFSNMMENAFKYTPKGSPIEVTLEEHSTSIRVSVIDHGEGIPKERLPLIFTPFSRGGVDIKIRHTGLGLGLAISHQIMSLHNGKIGVESEMGSGSTFYFDLPKKVDSP